jgi:hypothetical protein
MASINHLEMCDQLKALPEIEINLKSATIIQYTIKGRFMSR